MKKTFLANIEDGEMTIEEPEALKKFVAKKSGRVFVTVQHMKKPRSNNQNKYYWGVVITLISEHTGEDPQDVHAFLGGKFLSQVIEISTKGQVTDSVSITTSTTELSTTEFESYMKKSRSWASMFLSVFIPDPNECAEDFAEFYYSSKDLD